MMSRRIKYALLAGSLVILLLLAYPFVMGPLCITAATHRWHGFSTVRICPRFVEVLPAEVAQRFDDIVEPDGSRPAIEDALRDLGIDYSWDRLQGRYQGIIRAPDSNFHALVVHIYLDESGIYQRIDVYDSFTWL
nr:putative integron gene cassette protein [uncultured bacterium]